MYGPGGDKLALTNGQTNGPCANLTFNTSTNRISTNGFGYDAAGNLTADGTHSYQWDGEGRLVTVDNGATIVLVYNALGQQVGVTKGGTDVVWHLKSPADKSQGDYAPSYVGWNPAGVFFLGEKRVGFDVNGGMVFLHQNNLNSVTVPTTFDGSRFDDILYYPWGQYWEGEGFVFAGMDHYWQDVLHNTPNRQYAFYEGRWLSPDRRRGSVLNPQSWNRYAYVLNNPCSLTDPLGLDPCDMSNKTNREVINFINANLAEVQVLADLLVTDPANILGQAWLESHVEGGGLLPQASPPNNNYFGVQPYPNRAGAPPIANSGPAVGIEQPNKSTLYFYTFAGPGIGGSLLWLNAKYGSKIFNTLSPSAYGAGVKGFQPQNPGYPAQVADVIKKTMLSRMNCPDVDRRERGTGSGGGGESNGPPGVGGILNSPGAPDPPSGEWGGGGEWPDPEC